MAVKKAKKTEAPAKKKIALKKVTAAKKTASKKVAVKKSVSKKVQILVAKPIGAVTHFYNQIGVAIIKFNQPVNVGIKLHFKGCTTDFVQDLESMQYNHQSIESAKKGQEVGIKVNQRVRECDEVYLEE